MFIHASQVAEPSESQVTFFTLDIDPELLYPIIQLGVFIVMAGLVMRLKLFLTPQLCIIAAVLASRKVSIHTAFYFSNACLKL